MRPLAAVLTSSIALAAAALCGYALALGDTRELVAAVVVAAAAVVFVRD
jgi:hypothetical protein